MRSEGKIPHFVHIDLTRDLDISFSEAGHPLEIRNWNESENGVLERVLKRLIPDAISYGVVAEEVAHVKVTENKIRYFEAFLNKDDILSSYKAFYNGDSDLDYRSFLLSEYFETSPENSYRLVLAPVHFKTPFASETTNPVSAALKENFPDSIRQSIHGSVGVLEFPDSIIYFRLSIHINNIEQQRYLYQHLTVNLHGSEPFPKLQNN